MDMAAGIGNASFCEKVAPPEKDLVYWCMAVAERNVSICDRLGKDLWSSCIYYLARLTGDASICEKTNDKTGRCYVALAERGMDPSYCERIRAAAEKDRCYASSAAARADVSLCAKVVGHDYKTECYDSFIYAGSREMLLGGKGSVFTRSAE